MIEKLREIILNSDTRLGRVFDITIQVLIIISLIAFSIETLPNLDKTTKHFLSAIETVVIILFTIEYILRAFLTQPSKKYIFSFYGLIDLIAIVPFYVSSNISLQAIRALRLLRIVRIIKFTKYHQAYRRFAEAITIAKEELMLFSCSTLIFALCISCRYLSL